MPQLRHRFTHLFCGITEQSACDVGLCLPVGLRLGLVCTDAIHLEAGLSQFIRLLTQTNSLGGAAGGVRLGIAEQHDTVVLDLQQQQ